MAIIIYDNKADNCVGILKPMADCPLPIEAIARKDVPAGAAYRIVPDDFFAKQEDKPREDWAADFSKPDGHGADYGAGSDFDVIGYGAGEDEILMFEIRHVDTGETSVVTA
jgi:hypothetical protein